MNKLNYFIALVLTLTFAKNTNAQFYSETIYTTKDGLKNNVVKDLIQTKDGHLWMINGGELCKFDGKDFTYYQSKSDIKVDFGNIGLTELISGEIMLRSNEFVKFNPKTKKFIYYADPNEDALKVFDQTGKYIGWGTIISGDFDRAGKVLCVNYYGVTLVINDSCINLMKAGDKALENEHKFNHGTQLDNNGNLWFSNKKNLFNYKNNKIVKFNIEQFGFDTATVNPSILFGFKNGDFLFTNSAYKYGPGPSDYQALDTNVYYFDVKQNKLDTLNFLRDFIDNNSKIIEFNNKCYFLYPKEMLIYNSLDKSYMIIENEELYNQAVLTQKNQLILYKEENTSDYGYTKGIGYNYNVSNKEIESNSITLLDKNKNFIKIDIEKTKIKKIATDFEGNIWIASNKGLIRLSNAKVSFKATELFSNPLFKSAIYKIDNDENIWFYTSTKKFDLEGNFIHGKVNTLLYKYDVKNKKLISTLSAKPEIDYKLEWDDVNNFLWVIFDDKFYQVKNNVIEKQNIIFKSDGYGFKSINDQFFCSKYSQSNANSRILVNNTFEKLSEKYGLLWASNKRKEGVFFSNYENDKQTISIFNFKTKNIVAIAQLDSNDYSEAAIKDSKGNYWILTTKNQIVYYRSSKLKLKKEKAYPKSGIRNINIISVADNSGNIWITSNMGLVFLTIDHDTIKSNLITKQHGLASTIITDLYVDNKNNLWIATDNGVDKLDIATYLKSGKVNLEHFGNKEGLRDVNCTNFEIRNNQLMVFTTGGYAIIDDNIKLTTKVAPKPYFESILTTINDSQIVFNEFEKEVTFNNSFGPIFIDFNAIKFNNTEDLLYTTLLYKNGKLLYGNFDEINWNTVENVKYEGLDPGKYKVEVYCKVGGKGEKSEPCTMEFTIIPAWWQTVWFKGFLIVVVILLIYFVFRLRTTALLKRQAQLEKTIDERTAEVVKEKQLVEEKHKEITDSINYAERIQRSFLATTEMLDEHLKDYFVFFQPKDVVSGDFYWASQLRNGNFAFTCADSTGHGVPGAIMSILNISSLEKSIEKQTEPDAILNETRRIIIERLKNDGSKEGGKDGMDCGLLVLNQDKSQLTFAAANNPIFIVRNNELLEFKPDKMPVGKHDKDHEKFTLQTVQLQKGDIIYTLTDGFTDQFGGSKGKKYMIKNLKDLLLQISTLTLQEQEQKLADEFDKWKGSNEQVDDVCIIGVKI